MVYLNLQNVDFLLKGFCILRSVTRIMVKTYNSDCRVLFGDIFIVPFLGSALGYLIAMYSPGWGNLVAFDWNDLPVGRKFDGKFLKHVKSPPNPLPPPGWLYIDRCISLLSSRRHVIWHDSVFCGFWVRVVNQSARVFFQQSFL